MINKKEYMLSNTDTFSYFTTFYLFKDDKVEKMIIWFTLRIFR